MSTIQQLCPSCNRKLELPRNAVGRLAKCPACEATFTVDAPDSQAETQTPPPQTSQPQTSQPQTSSSSLPASGSSPYGTPAGHDDPTIAGGASPATPFSAPLTSSVSEGTRPGEVNPYVPTYTQQPVASVGPLPVVTRTIEDIFSPTLSIFGARWAPLVLAVIVVGAMSFAAVIVPMAILTVIVQTKSELLAAIGMLMFIPLAILFGCYLNVGLARNAIAVARNSPSPMMELLPPLAVVVRFLVGLAVMALVTGLAGGLFVGLVAALIAVGGNQAIAGILSILGAVFGFALAMVAYWLLWSWMFIVSDGKATALGSIQAAFTVTMNNKLTSVLLVVIATVLSTAGTSACYVGLLVTYPLSNLMFAVAYLLMTNQQIADPRLERQVDQGTPPPTQPTF